jgi:DNA-directed RNA polymerase specialized sigma24 family protein
MAMDLGTMLGLGAFGEPRLMDELPLGGRCRTTRWSVVLAAAEGGETARAALGKLYGMYWRPVFSAIARRRGPIVARELAQAFFVKSLVDRGDLRRIQRLPGQRFRGWLFKALHSFLKNESKFDRRQRRDWRKTVALGGPFDDAAATASLAAALPDPEQQLQRARVMALLADVLGTLRREYCKSAVAAGVDAERRFEAVKVFLPGPEAETAVYGDCAAALGMSPDAVKQLVRRLRVRFGQLLHDLIRQSVDTEAEVRAGKRLLCQALEAPAESHGEP